MIMNGRMRIGWLKWPSAWGSAKSKVKSPKHKAQVLVGGRVPARNAMQSVAGGRPLADKV